MMARFVRSSLQTRLLLTVSLLAIAAIAAVALSMRQSTRIEFRKFQDLEKLSGHGRPTTRASDVARGLEGRCCDERSLTVASTLIKDDEVMLVVDPAGEFVAVGGTRAAELSKISTKLTDGVMSVAYDRIRDGRANTVSLKFQGMPPAPILTSDGRRAAVYVIQLPSGAEDPDEVFLGTIDRRLLIIAILVGAAAIGTTWAIARQIVRPIAELGQATRDLAQGNLTRRVQVSGSDEVAGLGRSFNRMAAELERQESIRRGLVHDVAHELRTPLTALQCRLETVMDGLADDPSRAVAEATEEVRHLSRLVDDLEIVALAETREIQLSIGDVDIADVVASAVRGAGLAGDERVHVDLAPGFVARADVLRVRQVLLNLLTNAGRHTPPDGTITIRARREERQIAVDVRNTGSAIGDEQIARVFDRFYRADPSRQRATGGTGLGLAIVKHLVEAQGGRVAAKSGDDGVTFTFTLAAGDSASFRPHDIDGIHADRPPRGQ